MRQRDLFPDALKAASPAGGDHFIALPGHGWLRAEAQRLLPTAIYRGFGLAEIRALCTLCDYIEGALIEHADRPVVVENMAVDGINVWIPGLIGFRLCAPLSIMAVLHSAGRGEVLESDDDFEIPRPFDSRAMFERLVETFFLVVVDEVDSRCDNEHIQRLKQWLCSSIESLLKRDPRFQNVVRNQLPKALRFPGETHQLLLRSRTHAKGPALSTMHVRRVLRHIGYFLQVSGENPKLLPMLTAFLEADNPLVGGVDPIFQIKEAMLNAGVSEAGWRYLSKHGARLFKVVWRLGPSQSAWESAILYLRTLQRAQLPPVPPRSVATQWLQAFNIQAMFGWEAHLKASFPDEMNPAVLRAALMEADQRRRSPDLKEWIPEFLGVCWWASQSGACLDKNQASAGWPWLVRQWQSAETLKVLLSSTNPSRWRMHMDEQTIGAWRIVPLGDSVSMVKVALALRNCLADEIPYCETGMREYYAVSNDATNRLRACFGLTFDENGDSSLLDIRGYANSRTSSDVADAVRFALDQWERRGRSRVRLHR